MRRFNYLFMAGLMTLGLWSCSDDADITAGGENEISADKVYMSFKLELPTAGRSATDGEGANSDANPDSEVGSDTENAIGDMDVVLATYNTTTEKYEYVTESTDATLAGANNAYVATFKSSELAAKAGSEIYVFVFCNYPTTTYSDSKILNGEAFAEPGNVAAIATASKFWMSNASLTNVTLPSEVQLANYNTPTNAFSLGEVKVERAAARFDYAPKAETTIKSVDVPANAYVLEKVSDSDETPVVYVELTDMALINVSNNFHYLRHVAPEVSTSGTQTGYNKDIVEICQPETVTAGVFNYVVDSDATDKVNNDYLPKNFWNYWTTGTTLDANNAAAVPTDVIDFGKMWNTLVDEEKTSISSLGTSDNWSPTTGTDPGYLVWRYATENTLPQVNKQIKSLSTAVLFKGYLKDLKNPDNRLDGTSNVYVHQNVLYGNWSQVVAAATDAIPTLKYAVDAMKQKLAAYSENEGKEESAYVVKEPKLEDAADAGFTVYKPEDGSTAVNPKYPVYYYYINKHNTSTDNTVMGPMEFAVVRNNVYKLAVTNIKKYGHPADPTGDPDPENPDDPDEEKEVYFTVSVKVLPWVVRVNNIEF